jgi:hypothetical protein
MLLSHSTVTCHTNLKKYMSYKSDSFSGWLVSVSPETIVSSVCESAILFSSFATQSNLKVDDFLTDKTKCHTHNLSMPRWTFTTDVTNQLLFVLDFVELESAAA